MSQGWGEAKGRTWERMSATTWRDRMSLQVQVQLLPNVMQLLLLPLVLELLQFSLVIELLLLSLLYEVVLLSMIMQVLLLPPFTWSIWDGGTKSTAACSQAPCPALALARKRPTVESLHSTSRAWGWARQGILVQEVYTVGDAGVGDAGAGDAGVGVTVVVAGRVVVGRTEQ